MGDFYYVQTKAAPAWAPRLYRQLATWLKGTTNHSLGCFEFASGAATPRGGWSKGAAARLKAGAFCFARLSDGSELWLVDASRGAPMPVVYNGSETEVVALADSFEAFLHALAKGDTDLSDLDDVDPEDVSRGEVRAARQTLRAWLKAKKVAVPKAPRFDLEDWLGHTSEKEGAAAKPGAQLTDDGRFAGDAAALRPLKLQPELAELISLLGRRADDPVLVAYIERNGKKCPPTLTDSKWIALSKLGVELLFDIDTKNEGYPGAPKGKSFIPYLTTLNVTGKKLQLPFGVTSAWTTDDLTAKFGEPSKHNALPRWHVPLIPARDVVLSYYGPEEDTPI